MRIALAAVAFLLSNNLEAFQPSFRLTAKNPPVVSLKSSRPDLHEFDHIFDDGSLAELEAAATASKVQIRLPVRPGERPVVLASSASLTAPEALEETSAAASEDGEAFDPYGELTIQEQDTLKRYEQQGQVSQGFENRLKQMDFQDVISTLILPAIFGGFAVKWGIQRVSAKVAGKTDGILDDFSSEMIYHDGDFEEMKLCFQDYSKKLAFLGPKKTPGMLKRYLQLYAKKKTVSPQSIR
jgi:hypothetical protein